MAEHALYLNTSEPHFPFDKIRPKLTWLPDYLSAHITRYNSDCFLNVILVFSRARTSALLTLNYWNEVQTLTARLNAAAESVNASHHKLELFRCGGMFFITCRRSPRFQWTLPMSYYDVGRNLDYFAPGHMSWDPFEPKCAVRFIERHSYPKSPRKPSYVDILTVHLLLKTFKDITLLERTSTIPRWSVSGLLTELNVWL
jgi:hypothetical protein